MRNANKKLSKNTLFRNGEENEKLIRNPPAYPDQYQKLIASRKLLLAKDNCPCLQSLVDVRFRVHQFLLSCLNTVIKQCEQDSKAVQNSTRSCLKWLLVITHKKTRENQHAFLLCQWLFTWLWVLLNDIAQTVAILTRSSKKRAKTSQLRSQLCRASVPVCVCATVCVFYPLRRQRLSHLIYRVAKNEAALIAHIFYDLGCLNVRLTMPCHILESWSARFWGSDLTVN